MGTASEVFRIEKLARIKSQTSLSGCELPLGPQSNLNERGSGVDNTKIEEIKNKY